ncbi:hypothetical protein EF384_02630 [Aerococcus agrisoli]|uniref:Uncharacterized protein n=1 Tax=Aerococcus agrisoli TaxID=2487350 RepID=A0A3N4GEK3_9LACT|nr:hypothetical protein [Aerococcus agrisoli]RPA61293.1 hypothetical protein EF384_02630 [Aerococcus agrisoli]
MDTIKIKRALVKAQMGDYLPMVKEVPYAVFQQLQIPFNFQFKKIDEQVAAYIVANGYLAMFPSQMNQLNLIQKGNHFRLETGIDSDRDAQFVDNTWATYQAIKIADMQNERKESLISKTGTQISMWDKLVGEDIPELTAKQDQLLKELH